MLFQDFDRHVNVTGYDKSTRTKKNCRTVSAAVAYDSPNGGEVIIMVMHQAIYIPGMDHNLVCPMQVRVNGVHLNDIPKFLTSC